MVGRGLRRGISSGPLTTVDTSLNRAAEALEPVVTRGPVARPVKRAGVVASLIETTKPGITKLVTTTSMVGFVMAAVAREWRIWQLVATGLAVLVGTAMSAAGANAVNQWMERERDAVMPRTQ